SEQLEAAALLLQAFLFFLLLVIAFRRRRGSQKTARPPVVQLVILIERLVAVGEVIGIDAEHALKNAALVVAPPVQILGGQLAADIGLGAIARGMGVKRGIGGRNAACGTRFAAKRQDRIIKRAL